MNIDWIEQAAKEVLSATGHHTPQIMIVNEDDQIEMNLIPTMDDDMKEKMMFLFRKMIHQRGIKEYFLVLEGWKSSVKKGEELPKMRPRDDPNKTECLIISYYRSDLLGKTIMLDFTKEKERIVFGERTEITNKDNVFDRWNFYIEDASAEKWKGVKNGNKKI
jgi:hypothetical protein